MLLLLFERGLQSRSVRWFQFMSFSLNPGHSNDFISRAPLPLKSCVGTGLKWQQERQRLGWVGRVSTAQPTGVSVHVTIHWIPLSQGKGGRGRKGEVRAVHESTERKERIRAVWWKISTPSLWSCSYPSFSVSALFHKAGPWEVSFTCLS